MDPHTLKRLFGAALLCLPLTASGEAPIDRQSVHPAPLLPRREKSALEIRLEEVIDAAYRRCFRLVETAGSALLLRIPFGQNGERLGSRGFYQRIFEGGKGRPEAIWTEIERILASPAFKAYVEKLQRSADKVIIFDLEEKQVSVVSDAGLIDIVREGPYPGTRTRVLVLKTDSRISAVDIYNFLYCIGSVGLDCSGFIYNVQKAIAAALGLDLDSELASLYGVTPQKLPQIIGLWLFDPGSSYSEPVEDVIENLRPGDVFLFRGRVPGRGLWFRHSAVIQSIDLEHGLIRYLQCTDWAPPQERGVHESWIRFDPRNPKLSLGDPSLEWTQAVLPTFAGETPLRYWRHDGHRYLSYQEAGGSLIVRLKLIRILIESIRPDFYANPDSSGL